MKQNPKEKKLKNKGREKGLKPKVRKQSIEFGSGDCGDAYQDWERTLHC